MIKKAFILAAGLGTRLGEMSQTKPKALVEVNGKPMIVRVIERLKAEGISEFVVNIHHHGRQIMDFIEKHNNFGAAISFSDEREKLLDTGGALVHARKYFGVHEDILVHNADILSGLNITALLNYHMYEKALATLCVRNRQSGRALLFDEKMNLTGWKNMETGSYKWVNKADENYTPFAFSGMYLINTSLIDKMKGQGSFSVVDAWLELAGENNITGFVDRSPFWFDLGTTGKIKEAENYLKANNIG